MRRLIDALVRWLYRSGWLEDEVDPVGDRGGHATDEDGWAVDDGPGGDAPR